MVGATSTCSQASCRHAPIKNYEARLASDVGKGASNSSKDAGVAELMAALNALSLGVKEATAGVVDSEMSDVLAHLNMTAGRPAHPAAVKATKEWAELEEQEEIAKALAQDANDVLVEKVNNSYVEEDICPSDEELEPSTIEDDESGDDDEISPPSHAELSSYFGPLENYAEAYGMREAGYLLRRVKMAFLASKSATPGRQSDIRAFF